MTEPKLDELWTDQRNKLRNRLVELDFEAVRVIEDRVVKEYAEAGVNERARAEAGARYRLALESLHYRHGLVGLDGRLTQTALDILKPS